MNEVYIKKEDIDNLIKEMSKNAISKGQVAIGGIISSISYNIDNKIKNNEIEPLFVNYEDKAKAKELNK